MLKPSSPLPAYAAKVRPPVLPAGLVPRTALCELICNAPAASLVLLCAPAGFGKTTLMAQACARLEDGGVDTAWLTLDAADNDTLRFLGSLAVAVAQLRPDPGAHAGTMEAMDILAAHPNPLVLFVDEFEVIKDPDVIHLMRQILERLPRRSRVVLGSRNLPELGLGRLRVHGQLVEIGSEQMRFAFSDTVDFFRRRELEAISDEDLMRLHRKVDGWVAALWLSTSMLVRDPAGASEFIDRFSGSNQAVADYLAEDVLSRQPQHVRDFLLRTSILRHLIPSLCQAVSKREDSAEILASLAAGQVFVTPIVREESSYRYHRLFADYLRAQLEREQPDEIDRLHLTASGWYESRGRPVPAIDHAMDGGDYPHALSLLAQHVADFLKHGRMRLLHQWLSGIDDAGLQPYPELRAARIWSSVFTKGAWVAMKEMEESGIATSDEPTLRAHVNALTPMLLQMMDRHADAYDAGRQSLSRLPTCNSFADSVLVNSMSALASQMGDPAEARRLIEMAREADPDSAFNRMYADLLAGVLDLQEGRLRQATARLRMVAESNSSASHGLSNGNAWACVLYADVLYEYDQLEQTEQLLSVYLPLTRTIGLADRLISSYRMLARIAFARGDVDKAFQHLIHLEQFGQHRVLPRLVASARLERSRLMLLQGNLYGSRDELMRSDDRAVWPLVRQRRQVVHDTDYLELAQLRWEITFGDAAAALPRLRDEFEEAKRSRLHRRALKLMLLMALARERAGEPQRATEAMKHTLDMACQEGFMRLILDEGLAVAPLIQRVLQDVSAQPDGSNPIFEEYLQRLLKHLGPAALEEGLDSGGGLGVPMLPIEPLTRKELRVLELLAEGYSNSAMAEKLFVSDSTVRTHLRNVNMKLDAKNRTQAVAIARRLKLIA
jgi:LuxR family maltose regulon positive regulatory protein